MKGSQLLIFKCFWDMEKWRFQLPIDYGMLNAFIYVYRVSDSYNTSIQNSVHPRIYLFSRDIPG